MVGNNVAGSGPVGAPGYANTAWNYRAPAGATSYGLPGPEPGLAWAGIGARFGALLLDAVLIVVALFAVGIAVAAADGGSSSNTSESPEVAALSLGWVVFALIYHPLCWYLFGASLGQKALGMRIAKAWNGAHVGLSEVLVRYCVFFFATVIVPVGLLSAVMTARDPFKRAWHDQIARTIVVKRR